MKSKSIVLMFVSLGFGLIAAIGISQVMGSGGGGGENVVERGQVLLAAENLKVGDQLTEENIKIEHWPLEVIPEDAARSFEQIANRRITTRLSSALPIMMTDTVNEKDFRTLDIPKGYKLVAIKVSAEETVNGLLSPGDRVDVIGVVQVRSQDPTARRGTQTVSKTFLKNIEVYAVNGRLHNNGDRESNASAAIVGVLVSEKQSELIVLVQKIAKLRLVMRGASTGDEDTGIDDYGQFYESVFGSTAGSSLEGGDAGSDTKGDNSNFVMRKWDGSDLKQVEFMGHKRVSPTQATPSNGADEANGNDLEDYDQSSEIESGLEEDQYPNE